MEMGEEFVPATPSGRAVEQAILALKKGANILKYGRRGKPKFCPFRLSTDEKNLIWFSDQDEKQLQLSSVTNIVRGRKTKRLQPERECQSFTLVYANGECSLDLICKDKSQADSWFLGLKVAISRCHHSRAIVTTENQRGAQSCVSSPASFIRRKLNLGLLEGTPKCLQKVHSLSGSPAQSFPERCFSDGLSCSSDSLYSESSLSSMQNVMDILSPNSPRTEPEGYKREAVCTAPSNHAKMLKRFVPPAYELPKFQKNVLRDVFMWGGEVEGGLLGGGCDKIGYHNGLQSNALLPKLLESTTMLDVQKVSLGRKDAALLTKQGEVFCWGEGKGGRLGHKVDIGCPKEVDSLNKVRIKSVYCGEYQTCAVTLAGELYTWGDSCHGEDRRSSQSMPHRLSGLLDGVNISGVACGEWHMAIVSTSGQLFTYGDGTFGVLGHGNLEPVSQPKEVDSLKGLCVKSVSCGPWHTAAIVGFSVDECESSDPAGKLFTWGDGDKGRLGHADHKRRLLPTCVEQLVDHDFVQVSCGRMVTVGLTSMGVVYTMGSSVHGQLGNPKANDKSITIVQGKLKFEFVREIASGSYHIAVVTSRGNVYTWGKGASGQLGLGNIQDRDSPTLVEALRDKQVESIACGSISTAAICLHKSISCTDQSACKGCGMAFGFLRKKHNCYNCGLLFCRGCTSKKINSACLAPNRDKPFRVCNPCFNLLERSSQSARLLKLDIQSPRPILITHKAFSDQTEDRPTPRWRAMMQSRNYCENDSQQPNKNSVEHKQPPDSSSSLLGGLPRWGQVSCPESFRKQVRERTMTSGSVCSQDHPKQMRSFAFDFVNVGSNPSQSDKNLTEEVERLKAQAESLQKLCDTRGLEIQACQHRVKETWSLAKDEAVKSKAAKSAIKALSSRLHVMSQRFSPGKEAKDLVIDPTLPLVKTRCTDTPNLRTLQSMIVATNVPSQAGQVEERKVDSVCESPIVFSSKLRTLKNRNICRGDLALTEEPCTRRTDSGHNGEKEKQEWIEVHQPGVYITFTTLPGGQRGLKLVRFSRKRYTAKEAESWWQQHRQEVYKKYDVDGYTSSNHSMVKSLSCSSGSLKA